MISYNISLMRPYLSNHIIFKFLLLFDFESKLYFYFSYIDFLNFKA